MATSSQPKILAFNAGEDLSAHQYKHVKFGADEKTVVLCGLGERAVGILQNAPKSGEVAEVAIYGGGAKVKCVGVLAKGASISSDVNGFAITALTTHNCTGIAMQDSVANQVIHAELSAHIKP
jgi:hypothetical protein